jgi:putative ABC transport system permease protein
MTRLVLAGLAERRLRSALTGLAILLGVAMIAGTYVITDQIRHAFTAIEQTANQGNALVVTARQAFQSDISYALPPIPERTVTRVAGVDGVARAQGQLEASGSLVLDGRRVGSAYAPGIVMSDLGAPFNPLRYRTGRPPRTGEISVNAKLAEDEGLRVGRRVGVATRSGIQPVRLAGVFDFGDVSSIGGATLIVAPLADVQRWYDERGRVTTVVAAARPGLTADQLARRARAALPASLQVRTGSQQASHNAQMINDSLGRFLTPMLLALAGAALLVGAFIIFNTFSITVAQRVREFALLRSLGATRRQVLGAVAGEALAVGALASLLGIGAGLGFAAGLGALFDAAGFGIPRGGMTLAPRTVILSLLVGVGVTLLAAFVPAQRATRVPPVAAMAGAPPPSPRARRWAPWSAGLVTLAGLAALLAGLFGSGPATARMGGMAGGAVLVFIGVALAARWFVRPVASAIGLPIERAFKVPGRLARENAMRNPSRTAATSAALMVGLGLVVFVAVFAAGLKSTIGGSMRELLGKTDYVVSAASVEPMPAGAGPAIARAPGVETWAPIVIDRVQVDGAKVKSATDTVEGVDSGRLAQVYRFKWIHGSDRLAATLGPADALVEQQFAKAHGIALGSWFNVRTPSGGAARLRAVGEYQDPQILTGMMVAMDVFERISTATDPYLFLVHAQPGADRTRMHNALKASLQSFPAAEVKSNAEYREKINGQLDQMANMLYALLAMSVLISVFGIANSLYLSVHERTREFGLLRAIGTTSTQVRRIVRYESVITAVIGGLLGIALGLAFAWLMIQALKDLGFGYAVPLAQLALFLVVAVIVGIAAAAWPARRGARIDVLQALRYE